MTKSRLLSLTLSLILSVLLPLCQTSFYCDEGPCQKGQFLEHGTDGTPVCQPCPPNTYMDQENHMCGDCFHCMEVKDYRNERILKECTPEADRVVGCVEGYYRVPDGDPKVSGFCEKCTICADDEIIDKECGNYSDTQCFKRPGTQETPKQSVTEEISKQPATEETSKQPATEETPKQPVTEETPKQPVTEETAADGLRARSTVKNGLEVKKTKTHAKFNGWDVQEKDLERLLMTIFLTTSPFLVVFFVILVPILFNKLLSKLGLQENEEEEVEEKKKEEEEEKEESKSMM